MLNCGRIEPDVSPIQPRCFIVCTMIPKKWNFWHFFCKTQKSYLQIYALSDTIFPTLWIIDPTKPLRNVRKSHEFYTRGGFRKLDKRFKSWGVFETFRLISGTCFEYFHLCKKVSYLSRFFVDEFCGDFDKWKFLKTLKMAESSGNNGVLKFLFSVNFVEKSTVKIKNLHNYICFWYMLWTFIYGSWILGTNLCHSGMK